MLDLVFYDEMPQVHLGDTPNNLSERDFEDLARKTEGFSGSDISVCVSQLPSLRKTLKFIFIPCIETH
jgi:vacuolar protein-sorting-associated protein 4